MNVNQAPWPGEHGAEILAEIGYSEEQIRELVPQAATPPK